jgi:hypothetical protein
VGSSAYAEEPAAAASVAEPGAAAAAASAETTASAVAAEAPTKFEALTVAWDQTDTLVKVYLLSGLDGVESLPE